MTNDSETQAAETPKHDEGARKGLTGRVHAISGDKTISVEVERRERHPLYGKYIRKHRRLAVHDPENQAGRNDVVEIIPCRPLSKRKSWRLKRVIRRAVFS